MQAFFRPKLAALTVALFLALPLTALARAEMTCSNDGVFHIHKAVALEAALRLGDWYPRWEPHMAHGYGYPLFNFYAPLGSYLLVALHQLGLIYPLALNLALAMCVLAAGLGAFAAAREWYGTWAGVAAGVVYGSAPYLAFNVLLRGALAEALALVWPPLIMLCMERALRRSSRRWAVLCALCVAALVCSHNVTALTAMPLVLAVTALRAWQIGGRRAASIAALGIAGGLLLSAFFWIPALLERGSIQTDQLLVPPIFTYYTNYLTLGELLALPAPTYYKLVNPSPAKAVGALAAGVALLGSLTALRLPALSGEVRAQPKQLAALTGVLALAFATYCIFTLGISRAAWDRIPLLPFVQFPWRMLGAASLCAALLAGALTARTGARAPVAAGIIAVAALLGNLSWWYPRYCGNFTEASVASMLEYEYATYTVGTSAKGEFLPALVRELPADNSIANALMHGEDPQRLAGLPAGATTAVQDSNPLNYQARINTPIAFELIYKMFYFAGWRAEVDGQPVALRAAAPDGLARLAVPAGAHSVRIFFGSTPLRTAATAISVLSLLALSIIWLRHAAPKVIIESAASITANASAQRPASALLLVAAALLVLKPTVIDRTDNFLHRADPPLARLGLPIAAELDNGLKLLAYRLMPDRIQSGASFDVELTLAITAPIRSEFRPQFTVEDAAGINWTLNPKETMVPRWHQEPPPTMYWPVGETAQFVRQYMLLAGTPPGNYRVYASIFDVSTLQPARVLAPAMAGNKGRFEIATLTVARPAAPPDVTGESGLLPSPATLAAGLKLLAFVPDRSSAMPGEQMAVGLLWKSDQPLAADVPISISLAGTELAFTTQPTPGFPTSAWLPGDVWRGRYLVRLPANIPAGAHAWQVSSNGAAITLPDTLRIELPERRYEPTATANQTALQFGTDVELAGFTLQPAQPAAGSQLQLQLEWRALKTPPAELAVFVHVVAPDGTIIAQHDAVPANWARPTTGWLPGEYVSDTHALQLPASASGSYQVLVGLVDRATEQRLPVTGGTADAERALLTTITIQP